MELPTDPFILMSFVNQQLRDNYPSLDELCKTLDINKDKLIQDLNNAGFEFCQKNNRF